MVLRDYQEEAVRKAVDKIDTGEKLRIELSVGLGRMVIIARIANYYANKGKKVLVLSPNKSTCIQLENLIAEERPITKYSHTSDQTEYSEPMITTFADDQMQNDINDFYLIICDGISSGNLGKKVRNASDLCVLGFTSQVGKCIKGYFSDSECIFSLSLQDALDNKDNMAGLKIFFDAILSEDEKAIEDSLIDCMLDSISYLDGGNVKKENFYHGLLIGMLRNYKEWDVKSNREAGNGRLEILVYTNSKKYAFIIEVKYSEEEADMEKDAQEALDQIEDKNYDSIFGRHLPEKIVHYGIAFCKKKCRVLKEVSLDCRM